MLPEVTAIVRPPRALAVPFPLGYPLGLPGEPQTQLTVLRALLALCTRVDVPVIIDAPAPARVADSPPHEGKGGKPFVQ